MPFSSQSNDGADTSFLPHDYLVRKADRRTDILSLSLFAIVLFGVVGAFFVTNRQWSNVKAQQESINIRYIQAAKQIKQFKALQEQKTQMLAKAELTTALIEKAPRSLLLADLINRMPNKLSLLEFDLTSKRIDTKPGRRTNKPRKPKSLAGRGSRANGRSSNTKEEKAVHPKPPQYTTTLVLIGVAPGHEEVSSYLTALEDSPLLKDVDLKFSEVTMFDNRDLNKFRIEAKLRADVDARRVEPLAVPRGAFGGDDKIANAEAEKEN